MFITFEGLDGSGKSTQARLLADALARDGRDVVTTREPGGTAVGESIRQLLLEGGEVAPWTEAALFAAARAQLVEEVIAPALARGAHVVCDRYLDSSLAYQGIARGLGIERVLELNRHAIRGLLPDRTYLLVIDLAESARRGPPTTIRIDAVRELRRDLHMRPFEAQRRIYLVFGAHLLNDEAADALLKDLEEPPAYAVIVLVADELGPLPETIRSRCQPVPFRRLSERAVRAEVEARAPELSEEETTSIARVAGGRLDRAERLLDPAAARRRSELLETARSVYADPDFEPAQAALRLLGAARARATEAKEQEEATLEDLDLTGREAEQRLRRAARGAEREELLASLEELASWYRDVFTAAVGAEQALVHVDRSVQQR